MWTLRWVNTSPVVSSLLAVFHWKKNSDSQTLFLDECDNYELARMARDAGLTVSELRQLSKLGIDADKLVFQRMAALQLDADSISRTYPATMHDLQRLCSNCRSKKRCQHDLAYDRYNPLWRQYCPNAGTLEALQSEPTVLQSTKVRH